METNNHLNFFEEERTDFREIFMKWYHHWRWFLISILLISLITGYFLRRSTPEFNVSATILIKDAKKGVGNAMSEISAFQDLGLFSNSQNSLENEIEILKSRTLLSKVIKTLNLNIRYIVEGRIKTSEYYLDSPVSFSFIKGDTLQDITEAEFKIEIISDKEYSLVHEESGYSESHLFGIKANSPVGELMITSNFDEILIIP